ncbi:MAG: homoserine O-acetyltransferase, partial [Gemmataceae bacterium]
QPVVQHYTVYGDIAPTGDNVILVCHALSGSARIHEWWPQLFGQDKPFDLSRYALIGVNILGSCYGSTGPASIDQQTGKPYAGNFPIITISDMVRAQARLLEHLGVKKLHAVVGGSIGGMQALTWAAEFPNKVSRCIAIAACSLSPMGLALNHLQRQMICLDPEFASSDGGEGNNGRSQGLAMARALAMCTYKSPELFNHRFGRNHDRSGEDPGSSYSGRYDVAGYLDYQGKIFLHRFDPHCYLTITKAMDLFETGSSVHEEAQFFARIKAKMLLVGIRSDWLFPAQDVRAMSNRMAALGVDSHFVELESVHGHDAFLADAVHLAPLIQPILEEGAVKAELSA